MLRGQLKNFEKFYKLKIIKLINHCHVEECKTCVGGEIFFNVEIL